MRYTINEMLDKLHEFGLENSVSEIFLVTEFGQESFESLQKLGLLSSSISHGKERYIKEQQFVSKGKLAEFRARIKAETDNTPLMLPVSPTATHLSPVYYPKGQTCVSGFTMNMNPGTCLQQKTAYLVTSSPQFDNVLGFRIDEHLIVTKYSSFGYYPANTHLIAKRFGGRIPTETEFLKIVARLDDFNASMHAIDEDCLLKGYYLVAPEPRLAPFFTEKSADNQKCCSAEDFLKTASIIYDIKIPSYSQTKNTLEQTEFLVINIENTDDRKLIKPNEKCASVVVI